MTSPYQSVAWNPGELTTQEKLNTMTNNEQWLFENLAKVRYSASGINRETGVKILSTRVAYAATTARQIRQDVYWGGFFSSGCSPHVTATVLSHPQKRLIVTVSGLGGIVLPDNRGCNVQVEADELFDSTPGGQIHYNGYVDVHAIGY